MSSVPPAVALKPPPSPAAAFLARIRPDRLTLLIAAIALLGVALVLAREATYGVTLQTDSLAYIRAARDLLAGGEFFASGRYAVWPPFYPMLLAGAGLGIFDPYAVAGPLNAAIFGLTILIVGQYLRHRLQSRFLALWACLVLALSIPMAAAASTALTETPFILLATLTLILTDKFLSDQKTSSLLWAAIFCALAWQTRHLGLAAPVVVALALLFQRGATLLQKAGRIAGLSLIVALPWALWALRNYLTAGDLPGNNHQVDYSLWGLLGDGFSVMGGWLYSGLPGEPWLPTALAAAILIPCCGVLIKDQYKKRSLPQWRLLGLFGGFAMAYIALLIAALMQGQNTFGIQARFLLPMYIPLLIVIALALDQFLGQLRNIKTSATVGNLPIIKRIVRRRVEIPGLLPVVLMIALSLWIGGQIALNVRDIIKANSATLVNGYSGQPFASSETLRYFQENDLSGIVYSNERDLLRFHKYRAAQYRGMLFSIRNGNATRQAQMAALQAAAPEGAYLIWLGISRDVGRYAYTGADLNISPGFEPVAELSDGFVFQNQRSTSRPRWSRVRTGLPRRSDWKSEVRRCCPSRIRRSASCGAGAGAPSRGRCLKRTVSPPARSIITAPMG